MNESAAQPPAPSNDERTSFQEALRTRLERTASPTRRLVTAQRTQLSTSEAAEALRSAWKSHFGEEPGKETVAILTAQWSHETGNGRSMFNFNFGGIKGTGPSGLSVSQRTREGWGKGETTIVDNFRAYQTASEGAADYVSLLRRKYPKALEAAHQGSPEGFVRQLKKGGYFTGNESVYIRSVSARTEQILGHTTAAANTRKPVETSHSGISQSSNRAPMLQASPTPATRRQDVEVSAIDLSAFDDALSRAALRIALGTTMREEQG